MDSLLWPSVQGFHTVCAVFNFRRNTRKIISRKASVLLRTNRWQSERNQVRHIPQLLLKMLSSVLGKPASSALARNSTKIYTRLRRTGSSTVDVQGPLYGFTHHGAAAAPAHGFQGAFDCISPFDRGRQPRILFHSQYIFETSEINIPAARALDHGSFE